MSFAITNLKTWPRAWSKVS